MAATYAAWPWTPKILIAFFSVPAPAISIFLLIGEQAGLGLPGPATQRRWCWTTLLLILPIHGIFSWQRGTLNYPTAMAIYSAAMTRERPGKLLPTCTANLFVR